MKLLLKKGDLFTRIIKANFYGQKIIGELYLFENIQSLIPEGVDFHSHFIYFQDGNYHFSIKYFDKIQHVFVDRKTYYNHISTVTSKNKDFKVSNTAKRERIENNALDMFMMGEKMKPWTQKPIGHNFGTLQIHSDHTDNFIWESKVSVRKNDIVIDIENSSTNQSILL